ncbi:MAG TPA: apolipoprotein N-acyltransferase [Acidimicrobiales bacterium]
MRRLLPAAAAVGSGLAIAAALPPWGWWPLAFVGIAGLDRVIADRSRASRFRRGLLAGVGLYVPSLAWMIDMTAPGYLIAALFYAALLGVACLLVPAAAPGRWLALPGAVAVVEVLRWSWPFGGVPLSNLAVGQVAGPLAPVLRVGGTLLLVEVTLILGVVVSALAGRRWRAGAIGVAVVLAALGLAALAPRGEATGETLRVALVQGGGPQGTRDEETDDREVFERQLVASERIERPVDLVVWPEDVVDVEGPLAETREGRELADLARRLDAPMVIGVVEGVDDERFTNFALAYDADGEPVDRYDKVHRVPFGEYVPLRSLLEPLGGDALPDRDAVVGEHPARLDTPAGRVAVAISWEIFFGDRVREGVADGGQLVLNPTNGSSFTGTLVQTQQVATSRIRAIESGRWVAQVAPTGFTAIVGPDGTVHQRSGVSEQTVLQGEVGLRTGTTWYTRLGLLPGWVVAAASLALGWGVAWRARRRPATGAGEGEGASAAETAGAAVGGADGAEPEPTPAAPAPPGGSADPATAAGSDGPDDAAEAASDPRRADGGAGAAPADGGEEAPATEETPATEAPTDEAPESEPQST